MKTSLVFLEVFAILVVNSQAPVVVDRDSSKLPTPILSERAAASIVRATNMMGDAIKTTVSNEAFDTFGTLTAIRKILEAMNPMLTSFTQISGAVANYITRNDPLTGFISTITESFANVNVIYQMLEGKIKPSEYSDIVNAINDIIPKIMNLAVFMPQLRLSAPRAVGLDLQMVNSEWSTAIEGLGNAVQALAKAIQKVITSRIQAITAQKSIHKSLAMSGSYLSRTSTQLNDALENARNQLGMFSRTTVSQMNQGYYSITSNPTRWHQSVIDTVSGFNYTYSDLIYYTYLQTIDTSMKTAELAIADEVIRQTRTCGILLGDSSTYIIDRTAASANPRASECARKHLAKVNSSSMNRLTQCLTSEASNIRGISTQGQQLLTVAKNHAVSYVSQLTACNSGTDQCNQKLMTVYNNMVTRAREDLTIAAMQVSNALMAITERIVNCLGVMTQDMETVADQVLHDLEFCLAL